MSELTREQFPLSDSDFDRAVRDAMTCNNDQRWHRYLVAHDAALRARVAELEAKLERLQVFVDTSQWHKDNESLRQQLATVTAERDLARTTARDIIAQLEAERDMACAEKQRALDSLAKMIEQRQGGA